MKKLFSIFVFMFVLMFSFLYLGVFNAHAAWATIEVEVEGIANVYTNPGEDSTTSVNISWHSATESCTLWFTTADDTSFQNAARYDVKGVLDDQESFHYYEKVRFYKCEQYIDNLTPGTDYIYKIQTLYNRKGYTTSVKTFRTSIVTDYSFIWMSDIHTVAGNDEYGGSNGYRVKLATQIVEKAEDMFGDIDFVVTTGDEVWRGSQYTNWTQWSYDATGLSDLTSRLMWCGGIGNHEYYCQFQGSLWNYYPESLQNNNSAIYGNHDYYTNYSYNAMKGVPKNGPTDTKYETSAFWYLAGSVLFIMVDSMDCADFNQVKAYQNWFEQVCQQNEGKYQYLIVGQHYAWIDPNDGKDHGSESSMSSWYKLFDKYGVDVAISGHEHCYYRSNPLYSKTLATEDGKGTTYCVNPQIGNRTSWNDSKTWNGYWTDMDKLDKTAKSWMAADVDDRQLNSKSGATIFHVSSTGLTLTLIDAAGDVKDTVTLAPKRNIDCSKYAETVVASVNAQCDSHDKTAEFLIPSAYASLIKTMTVKEGDTALGTLTQGQTVKDTLTISGIQTNKLYDLTLDFVFMDGSTYSAPYSLSTYPYFGEVYGFEVSFNDNNLTAKWNQNILPDNATLIDSYQVFQNNTLLGTVSPSGELKLTCSSDKITIDPNAEFILKAFDKSGNPIYAKHEVYHGYGDVNLDGKIGSSDLDIISDYIFKGIAITGNMKTLTDVNNDGKIDYIDIVTIWMYNRLDRKDELDYKQYTVIFKDAYGKTVATKVVEYGTDLSNIVGPTREGYTFAGWSNSVRYITSDMVVYAVYNKQ